MLDDRFCKKWKVAPGYEGYNKINCGSCEDWTGNGCNSKEEAKKEREHDYWDREMKSNRGVYIA